MKLNADDSHNNTQPSFCYDQVITEVINRTKISKDADRRYSHNKFVTQTTEEKVDEKTDNSKYYSFGYRYFYWDFYKNNIQKYDPILTFLSELKARAANISNEDIAVTNYKLCDWYIDPKFSSLKDELTNNPICSITNNIWSKEYQKALIHLSTEFCKSIKCEVTNPDIENVSETIFNIKSKSTVTVSHIMSMQIYCNYDKLQMEFSKTYRKVSYNETDTALKKRHSNYYHFGRLLRELVECYGTNTGSCYIANNCSFYHGISVHCNFKSIVTPIAGPLSTSTDLSVALNFSKQGLILDLRLDELGWSISTQGNNHALFDCQWLSNYPNEQEVFFIGSHGVFQIFTIIDNSNGYNYEKYVGSMGSLTKQLQLVGDDLYQNTRDKLQITFRMLLHLLHKLYPKNMSYVEFKQMPQYTEQLFVNHLGSVTFLMFPLIEINMYYEDDSDFKLFRILFIDDNGWLKMEVITKIFTGLRKLVVDVDDDIVGNISTFLSILCLLKKFGTKVKLEKIEMRYHQMNFENPVNIPAIIPQFAKEFKEVKWTMYYDFEELRIHLYNNLL